MPINSLANLVRCAVTGNPGTGTATVGSAVSGYLTPAQAGITNGQKVCYTIFSVDGSGNVTTSQETGFGTYTSSGTTISRDAVLSSTNSNAAVNFSGGTQQIILSVPWQQIYRSPTNDFRLTTQPGVAVPTSDRTAQSVVYLTPLAGSGTGEITLPHTSGEIAVETSELTMATLAALTSGANYSIFCYLNSGSPVIDLSPAWSGDNTPTTALSGKGRYSVNTSGFTSVLNGHTVGAGLGRYIGVLRTTGTTTTAQSRGGTTTQVGGQCFLWNVDNQVPWALAVTDTTLTWSYTTHTWRQANAASGNKVEYVTGDGATMLDATVMGRARLKNNVDNEALNGIGIDSTTTPSGQQPGGYNKATTDADYVLSGRFAGRPGIGYHAVNWLENGADFDCLFLGNHSEGLEAIVWA